MTAELNLQQRARVEADKVFEMMGHTYDIENIQDKITHAIEVRRAIENLWLIGYQAGFQDGVKQQIEGVEP